jgi:hypothetical protein
MYLPKSDDCINSVRREDKDNATCPLECSMFEQIQTTINRGKQWKLTNVKYLRK